MVVACRINLQKLTNVQSGHCNSVSSSSSAEPVSSELLTGHNHYHHHKHEEAVAQETNSKTQTLQMTFRNPPDNYFFMKWNWPLIRKLTMWLFLSGLIAMVGIVIAMVWTLPKTCNPSTQWYQGSLMYEIFPASFSDSNDDGIGDFHGITSRLDYIDLLGVKAIRLNSIMQAWNYPEGYENSTSLTITDPQLGSFKDLTILINAVHIKNMYILLDLPVGNFKNAFLENSYNMSTKINDIYNEPITEAIVFWSNLGIDGFYLKGLENLMGISCFNSLLRKWKHIIGHQKAFIASHQVIETLSDTTKKIILNNIDLVDYPLHMGGGVESISGQIESILNSTLFSKPGYPWIHWSVGNNQMERLANTLASNNGTLGALLLELMLPGTPCLFYGDEIGLQQVFDPHNDRKHLRHLHQLPAMVWEQPNPSFTHKGILPWLHGKPNKVHFGQVEVISKMAGLRMTSPSIYINALYRDGINKANAEIKYKENDLLVIQRWYPRRKSYVAISNFGRVHISADLSTLLYSGKMVVGPSVYFRQKFISFKDISLSPGETVIALLD